jgi:hypothetical protein
VPAAFLRDIEANPVTGQAEIALLIARSGLQQLKLVIGGMRIMALQAVANGRTVDSALELRCALVSVTRETQTGGRRGDQLYAGDIFVDPNFMTNVAAEGNCGVDRLAFRLVLVASEALCGIRVFVERYRMNVRKG